MEAEFLELELYKYLLDLWFPVNFRLEIFLPFLKFSIEAIRTNIRGLRFRLL